MFEGKATLSEIRESWSLKDVWSANSLLDAVAEAEHLAEQERKARGT